MVEYIRVALGTGIVLGLWRGQLAVAPTAAHFLTYYEGRCNANCKFCPQARGSTTDLSMLSRVVWPRHNLERVLQALRFNGHKFRRICIQAVNYPNVLDDICELVTCMREVRELPISVSCQPLIKSDIKRLADAGVERVSVALDAATFHIFEQVKGCGAIYSWDGHLRALREARSVFGTRVTTHLIVGLGETEQEMIEAIQFCHDQGVTVALFAFTPIAGTPLENRPRPNLASYRKIQLARYLIANDMSRADQMSFENGCVVDFGVHRDLLLEAIESGEPFLTSGCPGCNRPFYNESPRGPIYNYPRKLTPREKEEIKEQLGL